MNLDEVQLETICKAGTLLIPPSLVAINLEVDELDFMNEIRNRQSPVHKAYYSGYLEQLSETRAAIIKSARNGSNPAQLEVLKFIEEITRQLKYE